MLLLHQVPEALLQGVAERRALEPQQARRLLPVSFRGLQHLVVELPRLAPVAGRLGGSGGERRFSWAFAPPIPHALRE